jgi:hypothetical protein
LQAFYHEVRAEEEVSMAKRRQGRFTETVRVPHIHTGGTPLPRSREARRAAAPSARQAAREAERARRETDRIVRVILPLLSAYGVMLAYVLAGRHGALLAIIALSLYVGYKLLGPRGRRPARRRTKEIPDSPRANAAERAAEE